ncbi:MAG: hypothetical protein AABN33_23930 [Acidobacteriota bacterium]
MRTRLTFAAACMLVLPLWFSASSGDKSANPTPFSTVAYAGHTTAGDWCGCGLPGCICDPGEVGGQTYKPVSDQTRKPSDQGAFPIRARSGFDFGTGALMIAFALFVWTRLRA